MAKEIWVVTYTSKYDDLYVETKVSLKESKARQEFADYIRDVHESSSMTASPTQAQNHSGSKDGARPRLTSQYGGAQ